MKPFSFFVVFIFCSCGFSVPVQAALVPHQAGYAMSMAKSRSSQSVANVTGKMTFLLQDSCESWITDQLVALHYVYVNGQAMKFFSHSSTLESKDSNSYRFNSSQRYNGDLAKKYQGKAVKNDSWTANFTIPEQQLELDRSIVFPTEHLRAVLEKATAGEMFFYSKMFDGGRGKSGVNINAVITANPTPPNTKSLKGDKTLLNTKSWKVHLAAFESADSVPQYEMRLILHQNGVVSHLMIEYKEFSLEGTLESLKAGTVLECGDGGG